jgi:L-2-hydroxyglutarate oxidase LhgO
MENVRIVIIGAGIIGLAVAAEISGSNDSVYVFEKNRRIGMETSSHNSGVIHSGIHYPKGSLKAMLCVRGNSMIYEMCQNFNIPYKKLGKLTVAVGEEETAELEHLMKMGRENDVEGLEFLDSDQIRKLEPRIVADNAIYTPSSGIVEPDEIMNHYYAIAQKNQAVVATETMVTDLKKLNCCYEISGISAGQKFTVQAETVINCAGLYADKIAAKVGIDIDKFGYRIEYCKGDYFRVSGKPPVKMLVYPVPSGPGLGIHLTPDMSGSVKLGPNTYFVSNVDYIVESSEIEFREAVKRYMPSITDYNISADSSGIRPKLKPQNGSFRDFVIKHESDIGLHGFINLIGIESPGITASPAIASYVSDLYANEIK